MSFSFWFNVCLAIASLLSTWLNHADLLSEIRLESDPRKRIRKKWGLRLLWFVTITSIVALPFTAWESISTDDKIDGLEKGINTTSSELAAAMLKLQDRTITDSQHSKFVVAMKAVTPRPTWVMCLGASGETRRLAARVRQMLNASGCNADSKIPEGILGSFSDGIIESSGVWLDVSEDSNVVAVVVVSQEDFSSKQVPSHASRLLDAFEAAKIPAAGQALGGIKTGVVLVAIPSKTGF